jgi:hypothetical protein
MHKGGNAPFKFPKTTVFPERTIVFWSSKKCSNPTISPDPIEDIFVKLDVEIFRYPVSQKVSRR